jgi:hypothetical protein
VVFKSLKVPARNKEPIQLRGVEDPLIGRLADPAEVGLYVRWYHSLQLLFSIRKGR